MTAATRKALAETYGILLSAGWNGLDAEAQAPPDETPAPGDGSDATDDDRMRHEAEMRLDREQIQRGLERLGKVDDRIVLVIRMRFGLLPYSPMTLREVAEALGLTRDRVRELESRGLSEILAGMGGETVREKAAH